MTRENRKWSVAQIGPVPPPHGGVSTNLLAIHEALKQAGHDAVIVDVTNRDERSEVADVVKPGSAFGLIKSLVRLKCDLVHYHIGGEFTAKLTLLTLLCGLLPGKKSVVTFHSGGYAERILRLAKPFSLRGVAFRSIDRLIGVNPQMMKMFRKYGVPEERISLISPFELRRPDPAVEVPETLAGFADRCNPLLLSIGALEPEYLNAFLIESMAAVLDRFPNVGLIIAGSGSMEDVLRSKVLKGGLEERVMLAGNIDHGVLIHLIDRADALLRLTEYDGDAISVREALFLGTPVVATDNGMRPDGVHLVSRPVNREDFVDVLTAALSEGEKIAPVTEEPLSNAVRVIEVYKKLFAE